jgi:mannan endo-1,6-alpha-mannosidase
MSCEDGKTCTTDMKSFKGYVARWMSTMTQIAPFTAAKVLPILKNSATQGLKTCTGGADGRQCGFSWVNGTFDGSMGAGQTMNVLGAVSSLLIGHSNVPVTNNTGGNSTGDYNAGLNGNSLLNNQTPITTADRAGAGILTALILGSALATFSWMAFGK